MRDVQSWSFAHQSYEIALLNGVADAFSVQLLLFQIVSFVVAVAVLVFFDGVESFIILKSRVGVTVCAHKVDGLDEFSCAGHIFGDFLNVATACVVHSPLAYIM